VFVAAGFEKDAAAVKAEFEHKFPKAAAALAGGFYDAHAMMAGVLKALYGKGARVHGWQERQSGTSVPGNRPLPILCQYRMEVSASLSLREAGGAAVHSGIFWKRSLKPCSGE
jgi:hypothetical protein